MTPSAPPCVVSAELDPIILPAIRRIGARLARGDQALAEDLAQEGSIGAWQAAATWWEDGGVSLRGWCITAARYRMIEALRRRIGSVDEALPEDWERGDDGVQAEDLERAIELDQRLRILRPRERTLVVGQLEGRPARSGRVTAAVRRVARRLAA